MAAAANASGGGAAVTSVGNSALFSAVNKSLSRVQTAGSNTVWTFSSWVYKCKDKNQVFMNSGTGGAQGQLGWNASSQLYIYNGSTVVGITTPVFRDIGWYHIHLAYNTGRTGTDKVRLTINGKLVTAWATDNRSGAGAFTDMNQNTKIIHIGNNASASDAVNFDGYMSETVMLDGTASESTNFGEYDTTGLYWTPKSSTAIKELTFGTNGFYLDNTTNAQTDAHLAAPTVVLPSVNFDGSNDYLSYSGDPMPDGTSGTFSCWFKFNGTSAAEIEYFYQSAGTYFDIRRNSDGAINIIYYTASNTYTGQFKTSTSFTAVSDGWHHIVASWNTATTTQLMFVDGVADLTSVKNISGTIDYTRGSHNLGADASGGGKITADMAQFYLTNEFVDLTNSTNLAKFITTTGYPVDMGATGATPTGTAAKLFFNSAVDSWHTNDGTGGGFTENGALTAGSAVASVKSNNFTNVNTVTTTDLMTPTKLPRLLWNPLSPLFIATLSEGNTKIASSSTHQGAWANTNFPKTGKWQTEVLVDVSGSSSAIVSFGIMKCLSLESLNQYIQPNSQAYGFYIYPSAQTFYSAGTSLFATGSVARSTFKYQLCWDASAADGTVDVFFGIDNVWYAADGGTDGNPVTGANPTLTNLDISDSEWSLLGIPYNVGTLATADEAAWEYTIQTGYTALTLTNILESVTLTANDTNKYFQTTLYEGNGAGQRVGAFQPFSNDFTVAKSALFGDTLALNKSLSRSQTAGSNTVWTISAWLKKAGVLNTVYVNSGTGSAQGQLGFNANGQLYLYNGSTTVGITTRDFHDTSQWHHYHVLYDTGASGTDKVQLHVDGVQITSWATDNRSSAGAFTDMNQNSATIFVGNNSSGTDAIYFNGYMSEFVLLDGTASAYTNFGQTDTSTNRWVPKDVSGLSYTGANSTYLNFADASDLGNDASSGGSIDYTNNNTVTSSTDSPSTNVTVLSPNRNSACVGTLSNGNRTVVTGSSQYGPIWTEMALSSGKWYWEAVWTAGSSSVVSMFGITTGKATSTTQQLGYLPDDLGLYSSTGKVYNNNVAAASAIGTYALNDVMGIALDIDAKTVKFYKNNSLLGTVTLPSNDPYYPAFGDFDGGGTATWITRFASADWSYSAPTDHLAVTQDNLAGTNQFISAFSWIKNRDATDNHMLFDRVRGATKDLHSNDTTAEVTNPNTLQSFLEAGVQVGNDVEVNTANESYVLWNWMTEATGSGSSNTAGSINTTSTLVDQTLGLSISKYTGTGANATIGHGLGLSLIHI